MTTKNKGCGGEALLQLKAHKAGAAEKSVNECPLSERRALTSLKENSRPLEGSPRGQEITALLPTRLLPRRLTELHW